MITQSYAEFNVRIRLVNLMVDETLNNWQVFLRTNQEWMGNIKRVEDHFSFKNKTMVPYTYKKVDEEEHDVLEREVLTVQQHRSQALTDNRYRELARSQYIDDKRLAMFKMIEQINLRTKDSSEFLRILSKQVKTIIDIEEEYEAAKKDAEEREENGEEDVDKPAMSMDIWDMTKLEPQEEGHEYEESDIDKYEKEVMQITGKKFGA